MARAGLLELVGVGVVVRLQVGVALGPAEGASQLGDLSGPAHQVVLIRLGEGVEHLVAVHLLHDHLPSLAQVAGRHLQLAAHDLLVHELVVDA